MLEASEVAQVESESVTSSTSDRVTSSTSDRVMSSKKPLSDDEIVANSWIFLLGMKLVTLNSIIEIEFFF